MDAEFDAFWRNYPRRIGKLAARKAFEKAIRGGATTGDLLAGIMDYIKHKPEYADYQHPASWLNAGRWMDEWDAPVAKVKVHWFEECTLLHGGTCDKQWTHEMLKRETA